MGGLGRSCYDLKQILSKNLQVIELSLPKCIIHDAIYITLMETISLEIT